VVKITNSSPRPVHLEYSVGFLTEWNSPKVDGSEPPYVIMPGYTSETVTDFAIPQSGAITIWTEGEEDQKIEIFVGPRPNGSDEHAWIQYRKPSGEAIAEDRWFFVGQNQMFGGRHVEYEFRIKARLSKGIGKAISFSPFSVYGPSDVLLNVYDLAQHVSSFNGLFANQAYNWFGFFHSGIEVFGEEWSFYRTESDDQCGICQSRTPKIHSVHVFRQSVFLGRTTFSHAQVRQLLLKRLKPCWSGGSYDLLEKNCISFCDAFAMMLGVERCPSWVRNLHESAYSITSVFPFLRTYITGEDETPIGDLPDEVSDRRSIENTPTRSNALPRHHDSGLLDEVPDIGSINDDSHTSNALTMSRSPELDASFGSDEFGFAYAEPSSGSHREVMQNNLWRPSARQTIGSYPMNDTSSSAHNREARSSHTMEALERSLMHSARSTYSFENDQDIPEEKPEGVERVSLVGKIERESDKAQGHSIKDSSTVTKEVSVEEDEEEDSPLS